MKENINKLLNQYWNHKFEDSYLSEYVDSDGEKWIAVIKTLNGEEKLIIGKPLSPYHHSWLYDGKYFVGGPHMLSISLSSFEESMKIYLENRFNVQIEDIW